MTRAEFLRIHSRYSRLRSIPQGPTYKQLVGLAKAIGAVARPTMRHTTVPRTKPPSTVPRPH